MNFRYYDIQIKKISPSFGPSVGGTNIEIHGRGLYDAGVKKIKFRTCDGKCERIVAADWDRKAKALRVTVPPLSWLYNEQQEEEERV